MRVFSSSIADDLGGFLEYKRSLGYLYGGVPTVLRSLDRFFNEAVEQGSPFDEALLRWLAGRATHRRPVALLYDVSVARQFCAYLRRRHPRRNIREPLWPRISAPPFTPTILTREQVRQLIQDASQLDYPAFRGDLYRMLLLLLYCTGLRLGEALRLRVRDVDRASGLIFIAESKGRARWIPFRPSLSPEIDRYLVARRAFAPADSDDPFFLGVRRKKLLRVNGASGVIRELLRAAGLKPPSGRTGPRAHDIRHTFAVHRLEEWYRNGADVWGRLPWLSVYMGHTDILGTETYLHATPEILALAGRRFHRRFRGQKTTQ